ncbi:hypothetical protein GF386_04940 [Candidatus Pacearchaeota archaeon]|nr:hypothetical protein [Candidatus Pacearchaeota archaeon]MBD3283459.1 hypothetical protein [Candidatus Pacearchaeota archaeon]
MNPVLRKEMQERNLNALTRNNGFQFTDTFFPYTSGQIGPYYVNSESVLRTPQDYQKALEDLKNVIAETMKHSSEYVISGGETRDWIFSLPLAIELGKPTFMIYKNGKIKPPVELKDMEVIHVGDLNNQGSSPRDYWIPTIKTRGGIIRNIFFYVDRLEDGVEVMEELELKHNAIVPLNSHAWDYLQSPLKVVTAEVHRNLRERGETKESRYEWALKMLRSDRGFSRLADLYDDSNNRPKAINILTRGYPELRDELTDRLVDIASERNWDPGKIREDLAA